MDAPLSGASAVHGSSITCDVAVIGSGAAALTVALKAAVGGRSVVIIEKAATIGGTSAMSGGMTWVPANHLAAAAGYHDSIEEAIQYVEAAAPTGWLETEGELLREQIAQGPDMLRFVEEHSALRFTVADVPDPMMDLPGAKRLGRLLSPVPINRKIVGKYGKLVRKSTLPLNMTYAESQKSNILRRPIHGGIRFGARMLKRYLSGGVSRGRAVIVGLLKGCMDYGCRLELSCRAKRLILDEDGAVTGVDCVQNGKPLRVNVRNAVVLATGGFEWDAEMMAQHFATEFEYRSSPRTNTGDGHRMAQEAGAAFALMDQANIMVQPPIRYEGSVHGLPLVIHTDADAIIVDRSGRRFVNEYSFTINDHFMAVDATTNKPKHLPAWIITHRPMVKRSLLIDWFKRYDKNWLVSAKTVEELAKRIGVDADNLQATVRKFNLMAIAGVDTQFGRGEDEYGRALAKKFGLMRPIDTPPYVAIRCKPSVLGTKGGVRTNAKGQALRRDGSVIAGLYCAGNVMANPVGTRTPSQVGTTIGPYMTWGFICAKQILSDNRRTEPTTLDNVHYPEM